MRLTFYRGGVSYGLTVYVALIHCTSDQCLQHSFARVKEGSTEIMNEGRRVEPCDVSQSALLPCFVFEAELDLEAPRRGGREAAAGRGGFMFLGGM